MKLLDVSWVQGMDSEQEQHKEPFLCTVHYFLDQHLKFKGAKVFTISNFTKQGSLSFYAFVILQKGGSPPPTETFLQSSHDIHTSG